MYERLKSLFERNGCTEEQLKRYVALGKLTAAECGSILSGKEEK